MTPDYADAQHSVIAHLNRACDTCGHPHTAHPYGDWGREMMRMACTTPDCRCLRYDWNYTAALEQCAVVFLMALREVVRLTRPEAHVDCRTETARVIAAAGLSDIVGLG